jgi:hypothetical protein
MERDRDDEEVSLGPEVKVRQTEQACFSKRCESGVVCYDH